MIRAGMHVVAAIRAAASSERVPGGARISEG
jgi:hypothetical protein